MKSPQHWLHGVLLLVLFMTACEGAAPLESPAPSRMPTLSPTNTATVVPSPTLEPTATAVPTATASWVGPDTFPAGVNPLTGLPVDDLSLLDRRPLMIKVSNYPASLRPHSGLSYADLVWEYFIGVGMTRFLALYYGADAPQVGPVRSGRLIDPQLVMLYGGLLGMASADPYVFGVIKEMIPGRIISQAPATCPALCRESPGGSIFADTAALASYIESKGMDNRKPSLSGMRFDSVVPEGGVPGDDLWIYFSYYDQVEWTYDPGTGLYFRSQEVVQPDKTVKLEPITDRLTREQLAFENVLILFAPHNELKPELIETNLLSARGARGLALRDGVLYDLTYSVTSDQAPPRFYHLDGVPYTLKPGNTWFTVVGMGTTLEDEGDGNWHMRFYIK